MIHLGHHYVRRKEQEAVVGVWICDRSQRWLALLVWDDGKIIMGGARMEWGPLSCVLLKELPAFDLVSCLWIGKYKTARSEREQQLFLFSPSFCCRWRGFKAGLRKLRATMTLQVAPHGVLVQFQIFIWNLMLTGYWFRLKQEKLTFVR